MIDKTIDIIPLEIGKYCDLETKKNLLLCNKHLKNILEKLLFGYIGSNIAYYLVISREDLIKSPKKELRLISEKCQTFVLKKIIKIINDRYFGQIFYEKKLKIPVLKNICSIKIGYIHRLKYKSMKQCKYLIKDNILKVNNSNKDNYKLIKYRENCLKRYFPLVSSLLLAY